MKKKILASSLLFLLSTLLFAKTYNIKVKGSAVKEDLEGNITELQKEDEVDEEDTLTIGEKSSVIFYIDGNKVIIKSNKPFKVKLLLDV